MGTMKHKSVGPQAEMPAKSAVLVRLVNDLDERLDRLSTAGARLADARDRLGGGLPEDQSDSIGAEPVLPGVQGLLAMRISRLERAVIQLERTAAEFENLV